MLKSNKILFFLTLAIVLLVYLLTLCPTIYLEDSAEFVTVAKTLGIPHPSGYPLYVLLGKLFTLIPWREVAWGVNLMSAFFGALACALLSLIVKKIIVEKSGTEKNFFLKNLISFSAGLMLAFGLTFWSQSVVAEVYTLNIFFAALIFYLLLTWQSQIKINKNKADKILLLAALLFGLSLANHQMMALLAPAFLFFILWSDWKIIKDYKLVLALLFLVFVGLAVYLYLPLRATQNPAYNWGDPQTVASFKSQILRQQYNDLQLKSTAFFNKNKLPFVGLFFEEVFLQFTIFGLALALVGFLAHYFYDKKSWSLSLLIFLSNNLLIIFLRAAPFSLLNAYYSRVYYLPSYLMVALWWGLGWWWLVNFLLKRVKNFSLSGQAIFYQRLFFIFIILMILFLPSGLLKSNWPANDRHNFWLAKDWARAVLESLDEGAYLLLYGDQPALDSTIFTLSYMQAVENVRRDVRLINLVGLKGIFLNINIDQTSPEEKQKNKPLREEEKKSTSELEKIKRAEVAKFLFNHSQQTDQKSVYLLYPLGKVEKNDFVTRSNGLVYKVYKDLAAAKKEQLKINSPRLRNLDDQELKYNLFFSDFVSDYFFAQAAACLENSQKDQVLVNLEKAIQFDTSMTTFNYFAFVEHRSHWQGAE